MVIAMYFNGGQLLPRMMVAMDAHVAMPMPSQG
jgi:hypothetical protein